MIPLLRMGLMLASLRGRWSGTAAKRSFSELRRIQSEGPWCISRLDARTFQKNAGILKKLFDWKIQATGPAAMIAAEASGITGHITALGHEPHHYTIFYVDVDDVAAYLEKAKSLGAKALVPPVEIPTGTFAWMQDPEGNTVGLCKSKK